jgi:hypothetical protein
LRTGLDNGPPEKSRAWRARQPKKNIKTAGWYIGYITAGCNLARSIFNTPRDGESREKVRNFNQLNKALNKNRGSTYKTYNFAIQFFAFRIIMLK